MSRDTDQFKAMLLDEFSLGDEAATVLQAMLQVAVEEQEVWETDDYAPNSPRLHKTEFSEVDGLPIVHSRKASNYWINMRRIYKNADLHEVAIDMLENAVSLPRLLYRVTRFLLAEGGITLGEIESSIYYLFWKHDLTPVSTEAGYKAIQAHLEMDFGKRVTEELYQACLDNLCELGLIEIEADVITLVELPRGARGLS